MKKLFICLIFITTVIGCKKQIERRFPKGYYEISILNPTYVLSDNIYVLNDSTIKVELISSENDLIELTQYSVDPEFDTIFASSNSELYIEKKKM